VTLPAKRWTSLLFEFANVFIFIVLGLMMTFMIIMVSKLLAPRVSNIPDKFTTYECGERPIGSAWILFNFRFYAVALAFLIFDIEMALVFPCVTVFRKWLHTGNGLLALTEITVFVAILFLGLIYMWNRGDLKWSKEVPEELESGVVLAEERRLEEERPLLP
jgi:NADH-quinone oxidoreductase subunit A